MVAASTHNPLSFVYLGCTHDLGESIGGAALSTLTQLAKRCVECGLPGTQHYISLYLFVRAHSCVHMYLLCSIDQVKESQHCNGDPHCWPIYHGHERFWEVNVGLNVLPKSDRKRVGGYKIKKLIRQNSFKLKKNKKER